MAKFVAVNEKQESSDQAHLSRFAFQVAVAKACQVPLSGFARRVPSDTKL